MHQLALFLTCVGTLLALVAVLRDPRFSRRFKVNSLLAVAGFVAYGAIGGGILIALTAVDGPTEPDGDRALLAVGFFLAWIFYGTLWLIRLAPRTKEPPRWLMRPWGWLDFLLLGVAAFCAAPLLRSALGA